MSCRRINIVSVEVFNFSGYFILAFNSENKNSSDQIRAKHQEDQISAEIDKILNFAHLNSFSYIKVNKKSSRVYFLIPKISLFIQVDK